MKIHVTVLALLISVSAAFKENICESDTTKLSCHGNMKLKIDTANYGRQNKKVCRQQTGDNSATCVNNVKKKVATACNDKSHCSLTASNTLFGDKCQGVPKYLAVEYSCKSPVVRVCEGDISTIKCKSSGKIEIKSVMYGRSDKTKCRKQTGDNSNNMCAANGGKHRLAKICDGKQACKLEASNTIYGDPCTGTNKYLEVEYFCS